MTEFKEHLKNMDNMWKQGKDQPPGVPDGQYRLQLLNCTMAVSKTGSGNLMIKRTHVVLDGEFEGVQVYDNLVMASEQNMYFIARWVELMGYEVPSDPADLEDVVDAVNEENAVVIAKIKRSGEFTNVNVIERVGSGEAKPIKETKPAVKKTDPAPGPETEEDDGSDDGWEVGHQTQFDGGEGSVVVGTITGFNKDETKAQIVDAEGVMWEVDLSDLDEVDNDGEAPVKTPPKKAPAKTVKPDKAGKEEGVDELIAFAEANQVGDEITDGMTLDAIVEALSEYAWDGKHLTPDEVAILIKYGIAIANVKVEEKPKAPVKKDGGVKRKK